MIERISGETRLFPIIGDPIIYVKSPERLTSGFTTRGHNGICVPMQRSFASLSSVFMCSPLGDCVCPIIAIDGSFGFL